MSLPLATSDHASYSAPEPDDPRPLLTLPGGATIVGARLLHPSFRIDTHALDADALHQIAAGLAQSQQPIEMQDLDGPDAGTTARSRRLLATASYDVWLITWPPGSGLGAHDHGDARSVIHMVTGVLFEESIDRRRAGSLRSRVLYVGDAAQSEPSVVHRIENRSGQDATSIHVYSPPLSTVTLFDDESAGTYESGGRTAWVTGPVPLASSEDVTLPKAADPAPIEGQFARTPYR